MALDCAMKNPHPERLARTEFNAFRMEHYFLRLSREGGNPGRAMGQMSKFALREV
jgi:hypothetical protein